MEKTPDDSKAEVIIRMFPSDANPAGNVFGGAILKHIDMVAGIVAQRDSRRNQATDTANRGYMEAQKNYQGLLPTIANVASSGLSTYLDINPAQKTFTKGV